MTGFNRILILSAFIGVSYFCIAQQGNNKFELQGSINVTSGKVYLSSGFMDSIYYAPAFKQMTAMIKDGHFSFSGYVPYPHGIRLAYGDSTRYYYSGIFFIEPGLLKAKFNVDSSRVSPSVKNSVTNKEYIHSYLNALSPITSQEKSLGKKRIALLKKFNDTIPDLINNKLQDNYAYLRTQEDTILQHYINRHPNSYVGLWILIEKFCMFGYKQIYFDSFQALSDALKSTYTGKTFNQKLNNARNLSAIGIKFPNLIVVTTKHVRTHLSITAKQGKYTLIDFWSSSCGPCIQQFTKLKDIYNQYNKKGFEIISISTDPRDKGQDWLDCIKEYHLPWKQYWDIDAIEAQKLFINAIPANFLLNTHGRIVAKNILPDDLSKFLQSNLK